MKIVYQDKSHSGVAEVLENRPQHIERPSTAKISPTIKQNLGMDNNKQPREPLEEAVKQSEDRMNEQGKLLEALRQSHSRYGSQVGIPVPQDRMFQEDRRHQKEGQQHLSKGR